MKKDLRNNIIIALPAAVLIMVQSLVLRGHMANIFNDPADKGSIYYACIGLSFLFGFVFWYFILLILYGNYAKNEKIRAFTREFLIGFAPLFILWILLYPGVFKGDEFYVLNCVSDYALSPAQGGLTSLFYIACLRFYPSMATISFMHIVFISCVYAYIFNCFKKSFSKKTCFALRFVLFILPVLDGAFFTLRCMPAGWCFLAALSGAYAVYKNGLDDKNRYKELLIIAAFSALSVAFRSELFYIAVLLPEFLILFVKGKEVNTDKKKRFYPGLLLLGAICVFYLVFSIPGKIANKNTNKYPISLVLNPISNILNQEVIKGENAYDDVMAINELIDVTAYRYHASVKNINQFWDIPDEVPEDKLDAFMKASYDLILNNFGEFLDYRMQTFAHTNSLFKDEINHPTAPEADTIYDLTYYGSDYTMRYYNSKPFFPSIRKGLINIIAARNYDNENLYTIAYGSVFYNVIPWLILCVILFVCTLISKKRAEAYIIFTLSLQVPLIFLTAPAMFFMYYYCFYLCAAFFGVAFTAEYSKEWLSRFDMSFADKIDHIIIDTDKETVKREGLSVNSKAKFFIALFVLGYAAFGVFYLIVRKMGYGYPWGSFLFRRNDIFTDFIDVNSGVVSGSPYIMDHISYPPFIVLIAYIFSRFGDYSGEDSFMIRSVASVRISLLVFFVLFAVLTFIVLYRILKEQTGKKVMFADLVIPLILLLSAPYIYTIDRGNYLLIAILAYAAFIYFHDKNDDLSAFFLGMSGAIKIYPMFMMLIYIRKKKIRQIFISLLSFFALSFVSLWFFRDGIVENSVAFLKTLFGWGSDGDNAVMATWNGVGLTCFLRYLYFVANDICLEVSEAYPVQLIWFVAGTVMTVATLIRTWKETEEWKVLFVFTSLMVVLTPNSFIYNLSFLIPVIALFIGNVSNEGKRYDIIYLVLMLLNMIPVSYYWNYPDHNVGISIPINCAVLMAAPLFYIFFDKTTKDGRISIPVISDRSNYKKGNKENEK